MHAVCVARQNGDVDALDGVVVGEPPDVGAGPVPLDGEARDYGRPSPASWTADGERRAGK